MQLKVRSHVYLSPHFSAARLRRVFATPLPSYITDSRPILESKAKSISDLSDRRWNASDVRPHVLEYDSAGQ